MDRRLRKISVPTIPSLNLQSIFKQQEKRSLIMTDYIEKGRMLHIRLEENTHRLLRVQAALADATLQDFIEDLLLADLHRLLKAGNPTVVAPNVAAL